MASETLTLSEVPTNPTAASKMLEKIESGDVSPHYGSREEIVERLKLAASGQLPAKESSDVSLFTTYRPDISEKLKELSASDVEAILSEALTKHCEVPVSVDVNNFELNAERRKSGKITVSLSVLPHDIPRDSKDSF